MHVYDLKPSLARRLNPELMREALSEEDTDNGINVSNVGGYHSPPDVFAR